LIQATVLACLAVVAGGLALLTAKPAAAGPFHGVVAQGQLTPADYLRMAVGKVGSLRVVIEWRYVERTRGEFDWTYTDLLASRAKQFGVRLVPSFEPVGPPGTSDPPTDRESRRNFARFVGKAVARYGRNGRFWDGGSDRYAIRSWQVMNEVNGTVYWGGTPNPAAYARILKAASRAIRKQDRKAKVVLAGMFFTPGGPKAIESWNYLRQLYREKTKGFFDTVAIHPYSNTLEGIVRGIQRMRDVIRKRRDREVKLRISEFGWGSGQCSRYCTGGNQGQAEMLTDAFRLFERKRKQWKIEAVNWFSWQDSATGACGFCKSSGLFTAERQPKPAWDAFREAAESVRR
jgi:polysaccharide biosynthesis protein PslG